MNDVSIEPLTQQARLRILAYFAALGSFLLAVVVLRLLETHSVDGFSSFLKVAFERRLFVSFGFGSVLACFLAGVGFAYGDRLVSRGDTPGLPTRFEFVLRRAHGRFLDFFTWFAAGLFAWVGWVLVSRGPAAFLTGYRALVGLALAALVVYVHAMAWINERSQSRHLRSARVRRETDRENYRRRREEIERKYEPRVKKPG